MRRSAAHEREGLQVCDSRTAGVTAGAVPGAALISGAAAVHAEHDVIVHTYRYPAYQAAQPQASVALLITAWLRPP